MSPAPAPQPALQPVSPARLYSLPHRLDQAARRHPHKPALLCAAGEDAQGRTRYVAWSYEQLRQEVDRYAHGLLRAGIGEGTKVLFMMRPRLEFAAVLFALDKVNAVPVLIDPGMGLTRMLACIRECAPEAVLGEPIVHLLRRVFRRSFASVRTAVTTGRRGAIPLSRLRSACTEPFRVVHAPGDALNAVVFTSGSTGTPKGVELTRAQTQARNEAWTECLHLGEDDVDLVTFPVFLPLSLGAGRTCVLPRMDFARPAKVEPERLIAALRDHGATLCFGSPALWERVSRHCERHGLQLPSIRTAVAGGAPISPRLLKRMTQALPNARIHTTYGATEALPLTDITAEEVLAQTAEAGARGLGTCLGRPLGGLALRIIPHVAEPIDRWSDDLLLPPGGIGEIAVRGEVVSAAYHRRDAATALAKIPSAEGLWHRTGDLGYLDTRGRLWFCGRAAHVVRADSGSYHSVQVEGVFNAVEGVWRTALVGVRIAECQALALVVELEPGLGPREFPRLRAQLAARADLHRLPLRHFLHYPRGFPVDRRHNAKIDRPRLAAWAQAHLG